MATANTIFARIDSIEKDKLEELMDSEPLPTVTASDNGKVLTVVDGEWAPAEGGGGSSDFSTAEVTLIAIGESDESYMAENICHVTSNSLIYDDIIVEVGTNQTLIVPIYKGNMTIPIEFFPDTDETYDPNCTGDISYDSENLKIIVSGSGSITLKCLDNL